MCLVSDPLRLRRREQNDRLERVRRERVDQIGQEMVEQEQEMATSLRQTDSLASILENADQECKALYYEETFGLWRILLR